MIQTRKKAQRSCVACRQTAGKGELVRFVRTGNGAVVLDATGRVPGRGAYVCHDATCLEKALASHKLMRALRTEMTEQDCTDLCRSFAEWEGEIAHGGN